MSHLRPLEHVEHTGRQPFSGGKIADLEHAHVQADEEALIYLDLWLMTIKFDLTK